MKNLITLFFTLITSVIFAQTPSVIISVSPSDTIDSGDTVTFTASPTNGGDSPAYQWYLNGFPIGCNDYQFTSHSLVGGDYVHCAMISSETCPAICMSSTITMHYAQSILFSETWDSGYDGWVLTGGAANGLLFSVASSTARWDAAHTSGSSLTVANNNLISEYSSTEKYLVIVWWHQWVDSKSNNAQHESGLWWDANNRIYCGNNATNNNDFFRIKIGGTDVYSYATISTQLTRKFKIILDRTNNLLSLYSWDGSVWVAIQANINTSTYSIPNTAVHLFNGSGAESSSRTGGDAAIYDWYYLTNYDFSTLNP